VVTLIALTTQSYAFEAWKIEGERVTESKVTLLLDDDYTANADFRKR
jgi:hypothetical protein